MKTHFFNKLKLVSDYGSVVEKAAQVAVPTLKNVNVLQAKVLTIIPMTMYLEEAVSAEVDLCPILSICQAPQILPVAELACQAR